MPLTEEQFETTISTASQKAAILIGGQALAYWVEAYGIPVDICDAETVTTDTDLFGGMDVLMALGNALHGTVKVQKGPGFSALIGLVEISQGQDQYSIVDVLHKIAGLREDGVRDRAIEVTSDSGVVFLVMHPMDVLESRLYNVASFPDRRVEKYIRQSRLAVQVVRRYIMALLGLGMERPALKTIEKIVSLSRISSGKWAAKVGVNLTDAIPVESVKSESFQKIRWPQIQQEMSEHQQIFNSASSGDAG